MGNSIKVEMGNFIIQITEEVIQKMEHLSKCDYMKEDIERIINAVIEVYNGVEVFGDIIPADICMRMISTLQEVKKDYAFLTSLKIEKKWESVLEDKTEEQ